MSTDDKDYKKLASGILNSLQIEYAFQNYSLADCYDSKCLQPCSYDLRVGTIYKEGRMIENDLPVDIEPGEIVTIHTIESLKLPDDMAATVFPINSQSSEGFMVLNPGHIDPGYHGVLTVKAINLTKNCLSRMRGDRIFTIIFEKLPCETQSYQHNIEDDEKKRRQLKIERDISPQNLFKIPTYWKGGRVFAYTENDVKALITGHWLGLVTLIIALLALIVSVFFSGYAVWKDASAPQQMVSRGNPTSETDVSSQEESHPNYQIRNTNENISATKADVPEGAQNNNNES